MKKIDKSLLKTAAHNLMFDMNEQQYDTLLAEFDIILRQMDLIGKIEGVDDADPMVFPFEVKTTYLREDVVADELSFEDVLKNASDVKDGQIVLPKVI